MARRGRPRPTWTRCPRGARPGDVLAAVRQQVIGHYAFPRFLARWASQPHCVPLLLGLPAAVLALALYVRGPIEGGGAEPDALFQVREDGINAFGP